HDRVTRTFFVSVGPPNRAEVTASTSAPLTPGQETTLDLTDPDTGRQVTVSIDRSLKAPANGEAGVRFFDNNPTRVPTGIGKLCFDVQLSDGQSDTITIDYSSGHRATGLKVRFFNDAVQRWLAVPATIESTATGLRLTVLDTTIFRGTVFAVGIPSTGTT